MSASKNYFNFERRLKLIDNTKRTAVAGDFVWGLSVLKIGSTYHGYFEIWDGVDGINGYAYYGKIYYGTSSNKIGPFTGLTELTELRSQTWTAGAVVNAVPFVYEGTIYMYWTGTTAETPTYPIVGTPARNNQRIGVASAPLSTPGGPFTLYAGNPIINPRPGEWDELFVNNPFPYIARDGSIKMAYKSCTIAAPTTLRLAIAEGTDPFTFTNAPAPIADIVNTEESGIWREGEFYYCLTKAQDATYVAANSLLLLYSKTGNTDDWHLVTDKTLANRLTTRNDDYTSEIRTRKERPFVLVEDGVATAFYTSVLYNSDTESFNIGIEIKP